MAPPAVLLCAALMCSVCAVRGRTLQINVSGLEQDDPESKIPESWDPESWDPESKIPESWDPESWDPESWVHKSRINESRIPESWLEARRLPGTCWACKWALNKVKKLTGPKATAESLKARLLTVCDEVGLLKPACRKFVKTHLWELIEELTTTDDVRTICVNTGACRPKDKPDSDRKQRLAQDLLKLLD